MSLNEAQSRSGKCWPLLSAACVVVFVAGAATWASYACSADSTVADRAWRSLLINFLYFFPISIGMVIWPAVVNKSRGGWGAGLLEQTAFSAVTFAPMSIVMFILLFLGREHWAAWIHHSHPPQEAWLNVPFVFIRDGAGILLLWILGVIYIKRIFRGIKPRYLGGWLVVAFCIVLTLIGFDMVMALIPKWYSTLLGWYFFVSSAYLALAAWTCTTLIRHPQLEDNRKHDLGKLIVAFSLLTMYMMFSQLIVIWYENLPKEVPFVIPRLNQPPLRWVSAVLLGTIYLGPLVFLLLRSAKRNVAYLTCASAAIMVGMWVERWWLVTPSLGGEFAYGLQELSLTAACAAAMVFGMAYFIRHTSVTVRQEVAP